MTISVTDGRARRRTNVADAATWENDVWAVCTSRKSGSDTVPVAVSAVRGDDDGDAIGLVDAEAAQEHRIDDRIHGCRDRDADRERENREGCEERRRAEPPEREPDVAAHGCRG